MTPDHFAKLERAYLAAPVNEPLQPTIHISSGRSEIRMAVQESFFHAAAAVHGSYYFKLLDDGCFFAANSMVEDFFVLTASFNIQMMRPVDRGTLIAVGEVTKPGKNILFAEGILRDDENREIARGSGVFVKSQLRLP